MKHIKTSAVEIADRFTFRKISEYLGVLKIGKLKIFEKVLILKVYLIHLLIDHDTSNCAQ